MHDYIVTDRDTEERTQLLAPNREAALKAYVKRRLIVSRIPKPADERWTRVDTKLGDAQTDTPVLPE